MCPRGRPRGQGRPRGLHSDILTNDVNHNITPFAISVQDDFSDHYVVGCCINDLSKPTLKKKQKFFIRDKSAFNSELYCEDFANNLSIYFEKL